MPITPDATEAELRAFYEDCYDKGDGDPELADRAGRWRALCGAGKAEHVQLLCARAGITPQRILEVGCGDGAILAALGDAGFGTARDGYEISATGAALAARHAGIGAVGVFDGATLPEPDHAYDLGILSHVLEHVHDPAALLRETARVCEAVLVEVPLEDNVSAKRPAKRVQALEIGHLQRFSRNEIRSVAGAAGLRVAAELSDPLPREVHRFWAGDTGAVRRADARWIARRAMMVVPPLGRRLITVHWAGLCVPAG